MATVIVMPRLSPTMEEGVLLKWTRKAGDKISPGDVIAEVETDKANMDFPLEDEGTLLKLLVSEGESVKLGAPVAILGEPGEDAETALAALGDVANPKPAAAKVAAAATAPAPAAAPAPAPVAAPAAAAPVPVAAAPVAVAAPAAAPVVAAAAPAPVAAAPTDSGQTGRAPSATAAKASPVARKLAFERGIDLQSVSGSGPRGRVIKRDVDAAAVAPAATAPAATATTDAAARAPTARPAAAPGRPVLVDQILPISPMRRTIARRLTESKSTIPHFYVVRDVKADALWAFHATIKESAPELKISLNDLILKATANALARMPEANASWSAEGLLRHGRVDLGIAVSIDDGLVTPVLRNANEKSIGTIAAEARDLIERARARKLRGDEFTGSTFSVSNMGMMGVKEFTAVINPPESGILAVGALEKRAVVETDAAGHDTLVARRVMTLTLSADHRILDGALAARLLGEIVRTLESPIAMVL